MLGNAPGGRNCCRHKFDLLSLDVVSEQLWPKTLLWCSEFRKIVAPAIRKKAITIHAAEEIMRKAEASFERCEFAVSSDAVLRLVARSNCTAYDCEFVALADGERVQLVTADRQILREFPEIAISLHEFVRD